MTKIIYVLVKSGPFAGHKYGVKTDAPILIGRSEEANIRIAYDDYCSRKHAKLYWEGNSCYIEDLNSTNGTFLNGVKIAAVTELNNGDLIKLGNTEMVVSIRDNTNGKGPDTEDDVTFGE